MHPAVVMPTGLPIIPPVVAPLVNSLPTSEVSSPAPVTPASNENSSSALDQAMAATLAAIEIPDTPKDDDREISKPKTPSPEPKVEFKDKKEAIEAFKEILKEKVRLYQISFLFISKKM